MIPPDDLSRTPAALRAEAEAAHRAQAAASPASPDPVAPEAAQIILHELQVHQIELEMLNEELRRAQGELELSRARYFDLYDLAPVGYCTVSAAGKILQSNLTLSTLLGVARGALVHQSFAQFILSDDQDPYYFLKKQALEARPADAAPAPNVHSADLRLVRGDGPPLWVNLVVRADTGTNGETVLSLVLTDISTRKQVEAVLRQREIEHGQILDSMSDHIAVLDERAVIIFVNRAWKQFAADHGASDRGNYSVGANYLEVHGAAATFRDGAEASAVAAGLSAVLAGQQEQFELEYPGHSPTEDRWFLLTITRLAGSRGGAVMAHKNISVRKRAQVALQASLHEKTALLNEVHHRVKNNLQVITSLLRLESGRSDVPATKTVLTDMQGRIRAMAQLHDMLYRSGTFAAVDLGSYLGQIATQSFRMLNAAPALVRLTLELAPITVTMDQAAPCGLLVNELISNCLKHGFPAGRGGEVRIALQPVAGSTQICLRVSDDGVGLPPDFAARRGDSLGLQLVGDLTTQLNATLVIGPAPAAIFAVTFTPAAAKIPLPA